MAGFPKAMSYDTYNGKRAAADFSAAEGIFDKVLEETAYAGDDAPRGTQINYQNGRAVLSADLGGSGSWRAPDPDNVVKIKKADLIGNPGRRGDFKDHEAGQAIYHRYAQAFDQRGTEAVRILTDLARVANKAPSLDEIIIVASTRNEALFISKMVAYAATVLPPDSGFTRQTAVMRLDQLPPAAELKAAIDGARPPIFPPRSAARTIAQQSADNEKRKTRTKVKATYDKHVALVVERGAETGAARAMFEIAKDHPDAVFQPIRTSSGSLARVRTAFSRIHSDALAAARGAGDAALYQKLANITDFPRDETSKPQMGPRMLKAPVGNQNSTEFSLNEGVIGSAHQVIVAHSFDKQAGDLAKNQEDRAGFANYALLKAARLAADTGKLQSIVDPEGRPHNRTKFINFAVQNTPTRREKTLIAWNGVWDDLPAASTEALVALHMLQITRPTAVKAIAGTPLTLAEIVSAAQNDTPVPEIEWTKTRSENLHAYTAAGAYGLVRDGDKLLLKHADSNGPNREYHQVAEAPEATTEAVEGFQAYVAKAHREAHLAAYPNEDVLAQRYALPGDVIRAFADHGRVSEARARYGMVMNQLASSKVAVVGPEDFPLSLRANPSAPPYLFVQGQNLDRLKEMGPLTSFIGEEKPLPGMTERTARLMKALDERGTQLVQIEDSGVPRFAPKTPSILVLASGHDRLPPTPAVAWEDRRTGAIVAETHAGRFEIVQNGKSVQLDQVARDGKRTTEMTLDAGTLAAKNAIIARLVGTVATKHESTLALAPEATRLAALRDGIEIPELPPVQWRKRLSKETAKTAAGTFTTERQDGKMTLAGFDRPYSWTIDTPEREAAARQDVIALVADAHASAYWKANPDLRQKREDGLTERATIDRRANEVFSIIEHRNQEAFLKANPEIAQRATQARLQREALLAQAEEIDRNALRPREITTKAAALRAAAKGIAIPQAPELVWNQTEDGRLVANAADATWTIQSAGDDAARRIEVLRQVGKADPELTISRRINDGEVDRALSQARVYATTQHETAYWAENKQLHEEHLKGVQQRQKLEDQAHDLILKGDPAVAERLAQLSALLEKARPQERQRLAEEKKKLEASSRMDPEVGERIRSLRAKAEAIEIPRAPDVEWHDERKGAMIAHTPAGTFAIVKDGAAMSLRQNGAEGWSEVRGGSLPTTRLDTTQKAFGKLIGDVQARSDQAYHQPLTSTRQAIIETGGYIVSTKPPSYEVLDPTRPVEEQPPTRRNEATLAAAQMLASRLSETVVVTQYGENASLRNALASAVSSGKEINAITPPKEMRAHPDVSGSLALLTVPVEDMRSTLLRLDPTKAAGMERVVSKRDPLAKTEVLAKAIGDADVAADRMASKSAQQAIASPTATKKPVHESNEWD